MRRGPAGARHRWWATTARDDHGVVGVVGELVSGMIGTVARDPMHEVVWRTARHTRVRPTTQNIHDVAGSGPWAICSQRTAMLPEEHAYDGKPAAARLTFGDFSLGGRSTATFFFGEGMSAIITWPLSAAAGWSSAFKRVAMEGVF